MNSFICVTCGVQFSPSAVPPASCPISEDEREFVDPDGQQWTTLDEMNGIYENRIRPEETNLYSIQTAPIFAIGQRAFLVRTSEGNLLWDCLAFLDRKTIDAINELGGIAAIAVSHPHFFGTMIEWNRAFGNAPIYLHEGISSWVMRPDPAIRFWNGKTKELFGGKLLLAHTGGHFPGSQVLLWPDGAAKRGVLLSGDEPHIVMNPKKVSFMLSYPNYIPLNSRKVKQILERLEPLKYDRLYCAVISGGASRGVIEEDAKDIVRRSGKRYLQAIADD